MPNAASALCDAAGKGDIGQVQPEQNGSWCSAGFDPMIL